MLQSSPKTLVPSLGQPQIHPRSPQLQFLQCPRLAAAVQMLIFAPKLQNSTKMPKKKLYRLKRPSSLAPGKLVQSVTQPRKR
mmetsp:Transcript_6575/g.10363  ORF Transcript_6575/g.10363 Transcript_6575/m.10363 type:complete len:82 (-) Transcript_6575:38-283(-)